MVAALALLLEAAATLKGTVKLPLKTADRMAQIRPAPGLAVDDMIPHRRSSRHARGKSERPEVTARANKLNYTGS